MAKIFIDGEAGTTGLGIRDRLATAEGAELIALPEKYRKDISARAECYNRADLVILCLPDDAVRDAMALLNDDSRVIDASSMHRTTDGWTYGFAELAPDQPAAIAAAARVTNPGCYATGAIALLRPLIATGLLAPSAPITINAVSGYSGGGRAMIEAHERDGGPAFELYGLMGSHKHLREITQYSGLDTAPLFVPSVGHFPRGMVVSIPLHRAILDPATGPAKPLDALRAWYEGTAIEVEAGAARAPAEALAGTDRMVLSVHDADPHFVLTATLDNLGKGASGAAVQNARLMLGLA